MLGTAVSTLAPLANESCSTEGHSRPRLSCEGLACHLQVSGRWYVYLVSRVLDYEGGLLLCLVPVLSPRGALQAGARLVPTWKGRDGQGSPRPSRSSCFGGCGGPEGAPAVS